ncbi:MAG: phosphotransferase, partial [Reyranella sp.]|nr:phosphotransferase [Reyranella sp.]
MAVQEKHRFDEQSLGRFMAANVPGFVAPVRVEQFRGGQSNPTYRLTDAAGRQYVLRRKPPGKLLPSAHAVDREFRVISALNRTDVPPPRAYALCDD